MGARSTARQGLQGLATGHWTFSVKVRPPPARPQLPLDDASHYHLAMGRLRWLPGKEVSLKLFLRKVVLLALFSSERVLSLGCGEKNQWRKVLKDSMERWLSSRRHLENSKEIQLYDVDGRNV